MRIAFFASGTPKPQPRPRAFARNMGGGKFAARVYDAGTAEGWKSSVAIAAKSHIPASPLDDVLTVTLEFKLPRPKSHLNSKGSLNKNAPILHRSKPDLDNLAKGVLDAMTQIGFWTDDGLISSLKITKRYTDCGDHGPGCLIIVEN